MNETTIDRVKLRETVVHIRDSYPEAWNYTENLDIRALADCAIEALDALDATEARVKALEKFIHGLANDSSGSEEFGYKEDFAQAAAFIAWRDAAQELLDSQ